MTSPLAKPLVERSDVPQRANYSDYREDLRFDFCFACAYCSITEVEAAGIDFQLDHYLPQRTHSHLGAAYANLMYACGVCNREKGDYNSDVLDEHLQVFKIDAEDPAGHFELDDVRLRSLTKRAEFNEDLLRLNRLALRRIRAVRRDLWESREAVANGLRRILRLARDDLSREQRMEVARLQARLRRDAGRLNATLEELIRSAARSPVVDPDPSKGSKRFAEYLRKQRALGNGSGP
jgi:hypothetical protein